MTVERADLSDSLSSEQTAPVPAVQAAQSQASPTGGGEGKPSRRPPAEQASAASPEQDQDPPPHRIDSLA